MYFYLSQYHQADTMNHHLLKSRRSSFAFSARASFSRASTHICFVNLYPQTIQSIIFSILIIIEHLFISSDETRPFWHFLATHRSLINSIYSISGLHSLIIILLHLPSLFNPQIWNSFSRLSLPILILHFVTLSSLSITKTFVF